ncbi:VOC family protein [Streptomyces sp. URMC 123]|uniref:VOC family protein n=1 Tax=Streptomyces sp. URMC 123 TaxID=3423403 RepID=UPI003F1C4705
MAPYAEGVPCWADAMLPDLEAGKRFYGELFGWTFGESERRHGYYTTALRGPRKVAALMPKQDGRMPTVWGVYFATANIRATVGRIREAGGQVITNPMEVGEFGSLAVAMDPGGAVFGLWQAGTHEGFEVQREPGSYVWTEVYTRAKDSVDAFYREIFGYVGQDAGEDGFDFAMWSPAGSRPGPDTAVCGRGVIDESFPEAMPSHFLVYFAVEDCDEAVRTTLRLGGRTVSEPENTPYGRFAILVDNQGASFAVIDTVD